jgi:hypothetical protein
VHAFFHNKGITFLFLTSVKSAKVSPLLRCMIQITMTEDDAVEKKILNMIH